MRFSKIRIGFLWVLGDEINTDDIVPSHVLTCQDESELVQATLEYKIPRFSCDVSPGDWIVAGKNFGCGSSREEAVYVFKKLKIDGIIAHSFARIFFRNAINLGLPVISMENALQIGEKGDKIKVDLENGSISNLNSIRNFEFTPFPEFIQKIISVGGLLNYLRENA